ncbi:hypothetical protein KX492_26405, partial [Escherichia coli]|nr:hypothetical protein [Escherichia coli]
RYPCPRLMPRELFCFSHPSGVFSLCMVGFYTLMGRFLYFSRIVRIFMKGDHSITSIEIG